MEEVGLSFIKHKRIHKQTLISYFNISHWTGTKITVRYKFHCMQMYLQISNLKLFFNTQKLNKYYILENFITTHNGRESQPETCRHFIETIIFRHISKHLVVN